MRQLTAQPPLGSLEQASSDDLTGHSAFWSQGCKPSVNRLWWSLGLGKNLPVAHGGGVGCSLCSCW